MVASNKRTSAASKINKTTAFKKQHNDSFVNSKKAAQNNISEAASKNDTKTVSKCNTTAASMPDIKIEICDNAKDKTTNPPNFERRMLQEFLGKSGKSKTILSSLIRRTRMELKEKIAHHTLCVRVE